MFQLFCSCLREKAALCRSSFQEVFHRIAVFKRWRNAPGVSNAVLLKKDSTVDVFFGIISNFSEQ